MVCFVVWSILTTDRSSSVTIDERLFSLVQWTIGVVLTVAIGLVGYNWIALRRSSDFEQQAIQRQFALEKERIDDALSHLQDLETAIRASVKTTIRDTNARLGESGDLVASLQDDQKAFRLEIEFLRKNQLSARMITHILNVINGSPLLRHRSVFPGTLQLFLELRSLRMNKEIDSLFVVCLEYLGKMHSTHPAVDISAMRDEVETLSKWMWMIHEAQKWIVQHNPKLMPSLEHFVFGWIGPEPGRAALETMATSRRSTYVRRTGRPKRRFRAKRREVSSTQ